MLRAFALMNKVEYWACGLVLENLLDRGQVLREIRARNAVRELVRNGEVTTQEAVEMLRLGQGTGPDAAPSGERRASALQRSVSWMVSHLHGASHLVMPM